MTMIRNLIALALLLVGAGSAHAQTIGTAFVFRARPVGCPDGSAWSARPDADKIDLLILTPTGLVKVQMAFAEASDFAASIADSGHGQGASSAVANIQRGPSGITVERGPPGNRQPWFTVDIAPGAGRPAALAALAARLQLFATAISDAIAVASDTARPNGIRHGAQAQTKPLKGSRP